MRNPKFTQLLAAMAALHDSKNGDYARGDDPYSNFKEAAQVAEGFTGVDAVFATLIGVKLARLRELTRSGKVPNNESVADTRQDLAMYATLWASYYREADPAAPAFVTMSVKTPTFSVSIPRTYDEGRANATPCPCGSGRLLHNATDCVECRVPAVPAETGEYR